MTINTLPYKVGFIGRLSQALLIVAVLFIIIVPSAFGKTLFAIVSDRSAADLASGADHFNKQYPGHQLLFRSASQFSAMSDIEVHSIVDKSDAILAVAVFGDAAVRLQDLLGSQANKPVWIINSTLSLIKQSRDLAGLVFQGMNADEIKSIGKPAKSGENLNDFIKGLSSKYPRQKTWVRAKGYWQARGQKNISNLIALVIQTTGFEIQPGAMNPQDNIRLYQMGSLLDRNSVPLKNKKRWIAIIDDDRGDSKGNIDLIDQLCASAQRENFDCLAIFARWGDSSTKALKIIDKLKNKAPLAGVISLQDFVLGGGGGREASTKLFEKINVPVLKGLRLTNRSRDQWMLSEDGLPWNSVHYRIAMPEIQGMSQPLVLATAAKSWEHPLTGLRLSIIEPLSDQSERMIKRITKWYELRTIPNSEKRVAVVYYNHPPGRHNIGADNLDVPESLWNMLNKLKKAGYKTGKLLKDSKALLDLIQERGVNLPEHGDALSRMAANGITVGPLDYEKWFKKLPLQLQTEMESGPLGFLHESLQTAVKANEPDLALKLLERVMGNVRFVLEGATHPSRDRARDLVRQLEDEYRKLIKNEGDWKHAKTLNRAARDTHIEGLRGWGKAPGRVMVHDKRILIPGIQFGNIFIGPQPPRGWELNEELLHANTTFPPTHQYMAFYSWLRTEFKADAFIHLGRHSTYEFLPRHGTGVGNLDYSWQIAGETPGIYPYIVDGVGEGIQAKRRGLAVMVSHLTPPLSTTELYDDLLGLRQLVESFEAADPDSASPARIRAVTEIRKRIDTLNLRDDLIASMANELTIRGIQFDDVDDDLLVHETGHYLTKLQENFMPLGLHIFGKDWKKEAIDTMMKSILGSEKKTGKSASLRMNLTMSPKEEWRSFLDALSGGFVNPGKGNDPIRTPEVLPTGRNFHALDGSLLPTRLGFSLGKELATKARLEKPASKDGKEAVILWASDAVRDEGAMIAFGFDMLGVEPVWNSRGILTGINRVPLEKTKERRDVVFVSSGLFRDLYGSQLEWLDKAVLLALDGASKTIQKKYPALVSSLSAALEPLGPLATGGSEDLTNNRVAAQWIIETNQLLSEGIAKGQAGREASLRIFGTAPGSYGAGVNQLVERSGSWQDRKEISKAYINRMGHAYGVGYRGQRMQERFTSNITKVENTYLGRASNLYGLMDNNDAFDYLGGLSLAVESLTGKPPSARIVRHADPKNPKLVNLNEALLGELRGQFLNPAWLKPLMEHDYAGARTMGSEFLEYFWGWQVTNPEIIKSGMWDEIKEVYLDDRYDIGLDEFLESGQNVHVKINMIAIMLVAAQKGFWQADEKTLNELSSQFSDLIIEHGLPGSGHTRPDHPIFEWIGKRLDPEKLQDLLKVLDNARLPEEAPKPAAISIAEIQTDPTKENVENTPSEKEGGMMETLESHLWIVGITIAGLVLLGIWHGRRKTWEKV